MFSKPDEVTYFGLWAEQSGDAQMKRAAQELLTEAAARCADDDMRRPDVLSALDYLQAKAVRPAPCRNFRKALEVHDPAARYQAVHEALRGILKG